MNSPRAGNGFSCAAVATSAVVVALAWQFLTIHFNRAGNWTALYCTGAVQPIPPALAPENIFRFADTGFDGQYYHYIAHEPLLGAGMPRYIDDPRLRYRRILVPALAHLAAFGHSPWVDGGYLLMIHLAMFAGAYWLARLAASCALPPLYGLAFLLVPAVVVSVDRLTGDIALVALCVAFVLHTASGPSWKLYPVLILAPLVRETGLLLVAAACLAALLQRGFVRAVLIASTALPCLAWYAFVHGRTPGLEYPASLVPLSAILAALWHPMAYADKPLVIARLNQLGDVLALLGVLLTFALAFRPLRRRQFGPVEIAGMLFAVLGLALQRLDHWQHVFDFGRVYSPLLFFLAVDSLRKRSVAGLLPVLLMYPRIALQLGSQVVGVVHGLIGAVGLHL